MADEPIEALGGKTPLAYAATPAMDELGKCSEIGMVHTIPAGMKPGSDTANTFIPDETMSVACSCIKSICLVLQLFFNRLKQNGTVFGTDLP